MAVAKPTDAPSITYRHDAVHTSYTHETPCSTSLPNAQLFCAEKEHTQKHYEKTMHACAPIVQAGCKKVRALTVASIICACKNSCGHTEGCLLHPSFMPAKTVAATRTGVGGIHHLCLQKQLRPQERVSAACHVRGTRTRVHMNKGAQAVGPLCSSSRARVHKEGARGQECSRALTRTRVQ